MLQAGQETLGSHFVLVTQHQPQTHVKVEPPFGIMSIADVGTNVVSQINFIGAINGRKTQGSVTVMGLLDFGIGTLRLAVGGKDKKLNELDW